MTEENIEVPLNAEVTETRRGTLTRSSTASLSTKQSGGNSRRNSTGNPNPPNAREKTTPHHLRASTGSCHDFCKYGHRHAFEVKEKQPIPKRSPTTKKQNNVAITISVPIERRNTMAGKLKVSSDSKTHSPDSREIVKREIKVENSSKQKSTNIKKTKDKNEMNIISSTKPSVVKPKGLKPALLTAKKPSSSSVKVSTGSSGNRQSEAMTSSVEVSAAAKKLRAPTISLSPNPSVSLNLRKPISLKAGPPSNAQKVIVKTDHEQTITDNAPEKTLHIDLVGVEIKNEEAGFVHESGIMQISSPSPKSLTDPSSLSSRAEEEEEEEDTEESEYTDSEDEDEYDSEDEIVNINKQDTSNGYNGGNISEENGRVQGKVKFRRGTVVDLECENNGPRKLRFRRGRTLGDNEVGKGDVRRRKFKNRGIDKGVNDSSNKSEKVVLRHQDGQEKKDAQGLFNNVIEETANKLVETRKSKVKALVGAFETVISLQETMNKPSTPTASTPIASSPIASTAAVS